jgi:hypothetical protein
MSRPRSSSNLPLNPASPYLLHPLCSDSSLDSEEPHSASATEDEEDEPPSPAEQDLLLRSPQYYVQVLQKSPLTYDARLVVEYLLGSKNSLVPSAQRPILWEFGPEDASSGSISYGRKIQAIFVLIFILAFTISSAFHDSAVFVPALLTVVMNAFLQVSVEILEIVINRKLVRSISDITRFRVFHGETLGDIPQSLTDAEVATCLATNPLAFLSAEECRQWLDVFSTDPPISLKAALWVKGIYTGVSRLQNVRSYRSVVVRSLSIFVHGCLYLSPFLWILQSNRDAQVFGGSLHVCILLIVLFAILIHDFLASYRQIDLMIRTYLLQKMYSAIYSFKCERQRSLFEGRKKNNPKRLWFNQYKQASHLSIALLKYHMFEWLEIAFGTPL